MNLLGHREWLETLVSYYGSLAAFDDARTVRIMLRFLYEKIKEETDFRATLAPHPEELAEWMAHSEPVLLEARGYAKDLEDWLINRGLTP